MGIFVVLLFISGCLMWVNVELNVSDVFVVIWLLGSEGDVISDVFFKNVDGLINYDFKGKLLFLWLNDLIGN